nr:MAG TPA: hypothetical protein [Caudoviricetes sp.]
MNNYSIKNMTMVLYLFAYCLPIFNKIYKVI